MPERFGKQIIYGTIFIAIIGGIIAGFYFYLRQAPTCFDNRKNQSEQQVDCGGPCKSCDIKKLEPIRVQNAQAVFVAQNSVSLSAEVTNPNAKFGSDSFHYTWEVFDTNGTSLRTIDDDSYIYPSETKYIISPPIALPFSSIGRVTLTIKNPSWEPIDKFHKPDIVIQQLETRRGDNTTMVASGSLINNEAFLLSRVRIVGVLFDATGEVVAVSFTKYQDIGAFEQRFYQVTFAISSDIMARVDTTRTKVFIETVLPR